MEPLAETATRSVAVIGAGTMGPGIALTFARYGCEVHLCDKSSEALRTAERVARDAAGLFVEAGALPENELAPTLARLHFTTSLAVAAREADFVVEAIFEEKEAKRALLQELDAICPPHTVFASNTSYLNVFDGAARPSQTVIAHWFAPPHILPLVEVVRGPETADATVETTVNLLRGAGKTPVVLQRFLPGFAVNRLQRVLGNEMFFLLDNGYISAEDLDLAVKASVAPRMMLLGLAQRYDFAGLDLTARNLQNPGFEAAPADHHPACIFEHVEAGEYGVKSGKGFFDYSRRALGDVLRERDEKLLAIVRHADSLGANAPIG